MTRGWHTSRSRSVPRAWVALIACVVCGAAPACVVAQDLGAERSDTGPATPADAAPWGDETTALALDADPVMSREQACPLSEPEAWSPCALTQADAPCMYPIHDPKTGAALETSAICACVYAGDLQDLAGTPVGRWACVGATVRRLGTPRPLLGTLCAGSFLVKHTCVDAECPLLCGTSKSCTLYCRCDGGRVRCD